MKRITLWLYLYTQQSSFGDTYISINPKRLIYKRFNRPMKNTLYIVLLLLSHLVIAQRFNYHKLSVERPQVALLYNITTPTKVTFNVLNRTTPNYTYEPMAVGNMDAYIKQLGNTNIQADTNKPDLLFTLDLINQPTLVRVDQEKKKDGKEIYHIFIMSQIVGDLYVIDAKKQIVIYKTPIQFHSNTTANPSYSNVPKIENGNGTYFAQYIISNIPSQNLKAYVKRTSNGYLPNPDYEVKINNVQIDQIIKKALYHLKRCFTNGTYTDAYSFTSVKKMKDYDFSNFNSAIDLVEGTEVNKINLEKAISIWQAELQKIDILDKKQKKLAIEAYQNIVNAYYFLEDQGKIDTTLESLKTVIPPHQYESFTRNVKNRQEKQKEKSKSLTLLNEKIPKFIQLN